MSEGLTTYDFVQQVYYAQEKVILDFWPNDDKFKEVLFEANLILQELQNVEDWTWLREQLVLGSCHHMPNEIPEFKLPPWVYKPSTLFHDGIKLHPIHNTVHGPHCGDWLDCKPGRDYDEYRFIDVPFASTGDNRYMRDRIVNPHSVVHRKDGTLKAIRIGDIITFNRPLLPHEERCVAVMDVQRRIEQFHICDENCEIITEYEKKIDGVWTTVDLLKPVCKSEADLEYKRENGTKHLVGVYPKRYLTEIPDPNYVVMATAARHAEGSPPALARVAGLQDAAQKIMSAMRQNDTSATESDYADWDPIGYIEVI